MSTKTASLKLVTSAEQAAELSSLAEVYAKACDMVAAFAREHRCWNRVALHHLAYYPVREAIPTLGSQMACQAVHRAADASNPTAAAQPSANSRLSLGARNGA